jgi:hypothetical protein
MPLAGIDCTDDDFSEADRSQAYNQMYGLSRLSLPRFLWPLGSRDPSFGSRQSERSLKWLTDFATILAFAPGEKVAASALRDNNGGIELLWTKNTPVQAEDLAYLESILDRQCSSSWQFFKQVIVPKCRPRILYLAEQLTHCYQPILGNNIFGWEEKKKRIVGFETASSKPVRLLKVTKLRITTKRFLLVNTWTRLFGWPHD